MTELNDRFEGEMRACSVPDMEPESEGDRKPPWAATDDLDVETRKFAAAARAAALNALSVRLEASLLEAAIKSGRLVRLEMLSKVPHENARRTGMGSSGKRLMDVERGDVSSSFGVMRFDSRMVIRDREWKGCGVESALGAFI